MSVISDLWPDNPMQIGMNHRFAVRIDKSRYDLGDWAKVTGLSVTWQKIEYRVGEHGNHVWINPGTTKYEPITLHRAAGGASKVVKEWLEKTSKHMQPLSGAIQLLGYPNIVLMEWRLQEFFPIAWSIDGFDAAGAKPAIEMLKLAHSGFLEDDVNSQASSPAADWDDD